MFVFFMAIALSFDSRMPIQEEDHGLLVHFCNPFFAAFFSLPVSHDLPPPIASGVSRIGSPILFPVAWIFRCPLSLGTHLVAAVLSITMQFLFLP